MRRLRLSIGLAAAVSIAVSTAAMPPALADDHDDHARAYRALRDGAVLPLADILDIVHAAIPGRVIEIEFEDDDDRLLYELEVVTADGRLIEVEVDAATGRILSQEEEDD